MSYSEPLIKEMKKNVYHLTIKQPITDHHPHLHPFLHQLETFFRKGMRRNGSVFDSAMKDYWVCFEQFFHYLIQAKTNFPPFMEEAFVNIKKSRKLTTDQGRGRSFLRQSLQYRFLDNFVSLLHTHKTFLHIWYYGDTCLLYDNIQVEIFSSVLKQLNQLKLQLNLKNQSFLDQTLIMPIYKTVTLVPCHKLGVEILHIKGHCLVSSMEEGSVIAESGEVCVGDVVDEVTGAALRNCRVGTISSLLRKMKQAPIEMAILKSELSDGSLFKGISELSKGLNLQQCKPDNKRHSTRAPPQSLLQLNDEIPVHNNGDRAIYETTYLGCVFIGQNGSVNKIEDSIGVMMSYISKNFDDDDGGGGDDDDDGGDDDDDGGDGGDGDGGDGGGDDDGGDGGGDDDGGDGGDDDGGDGGGDDNSGDKCNNNADNDNIKSDDKDNANDKSDHNNKKNNKKNNNKNGYVEYIHTDNLYYQVKAKRLETLVHLGETDFNVLKKKKTILSASYTEISACGRVDDDALLFTCLIGETTCTIATQFVAHVFKASSASDAKIILCTIAQGFERTHWFV